jgi:hypothetical protein
VRSRPARQREGGQGQTQRRRQAVTGPETGRWRRGQRPGTGLGGDGKQQSAQPCTNSPAAQPFASPGSNRHQLRQHRQARCSTGCWPGVCDQGHRLQQKYQHKSQENSGQSLVACGNRLLPVAIACCLWQSLVACGNRLLPMAIVIASLCLGSSGKPVAAECHLFAPTALSTLASASRRDIPEVPHPDSLRCHGNRRGVSRGCFGDTIPACPRAADEARCRSGPCSSHGCARPAADAPCPGWGGWWSRQLASPDAAVG